MRWLLRFVAHVAAERRRSSLLRFRQVDTTRKLRDLLDILRFPAYLSSRPVAITSDVDWLFLAFQLVALSSTYSFELLRGTDHWKCMVRPFEIEELLSTQ